MTVVWTKHAARRCLERKINAPKIEGLVEQAAETGALPLNGTAVVTAGKTAVVVADACRIVTLFSLPPRRWPSRKHGRERGRSRRDDTRRAIEESLEGVA